MGGVGLAGWGIGTEPIERVKARARHGWLFAEAVSRGRGDLAIAIAIAIAIASATNKGRQLSDSEHRVHTTQAQGSTHSTPLHHHYSYSYDGRTAACSSNMHHARGMDGKAKDGRELVQLK
jgi:hypothetical protein